jgi:hypothetical protein
MFIFEKRSPYGVVVAPKNEEFFASDKRDSAQSLVREVSQNSGDAGRSPDRPVVLTFDFREIERPYFNEHCVGDLRQHLDACSADGVVADILDDNAPTVRYLAIEDFETTGLEGSYSASYDEKSNFINFWRRYGQSSKTGDSGGRHGVGKSTIAAASRLHFFYGATVRASDKKLLLYGQATLAVHQLPGDSSVCDPYGLFSPADGTDPVPFEGIDAEWFMSAFELKRGSKPGLSLVIPFPRDEVAEASIVKASIEHCFHQIISGHLIVRVGARELSRTTIMEHAKEIPSLKGLLSAIDISLYATEPAASSTFLPIPSFKEERLSATSFSIEDLEAMRRRWADGKPVGVTLTAVIRPRTGREETGQVAIYVAPEKDSTKARETYVRGRVTVVSKKSTGSFVGLFVANQDIISQFLGDAEPPAHDRWIMAKVKPLYSKPEDAFRKLLNSLSDLYALLAETEEDQPIKDALTKYFWTPKTEKATSEKTLPRPEEWVPPPPTQPKPFEVRKINDGFSFSYKRAIGTKRNDPKPAFRIEVRYDVRRGAPSWDREDFDFRDSSTIGIESAKCTVDVEREGGAIFLADVENGAELKVRGFDPRRDLIIAVSEVDINA